jgi:hypothetical protein
VRRVRLRLAPICVVVAVLVGATPAGAAPPKLLFGLGPEADGARRSELVQQSPVRMLTSWYNGPEDLAWMTRWRTSEVPRAYRAGFALHLVVWTGDRERSIATRHGEACGRAYPLSTRFVDDMRRLARTFAGAATGPPLYVTLFSEFQTYPCRDNAWSPDDATRAYYRALKDRYREVMGVFHRLAPNARVSLGWGGWQARWDDPAVDGGRSLFARFADVMRASDFQSFQAMDSNGNAGDIFAMTRTLGAYGPVMLAHYKPDDGSQLTFDADVRAILTDATLRRLHSLGLFALSFMDATNLDREPATYDFVRRAALRYGARA